MNCPFCESASVRELSDLHESVKLGRRTTSVAGLLRSVCDKCGEFFVTAAQHDANINKIRKATAALVPITPREVREIRSRLGLSQSEAQRLFGGGANAFSKYENGKVVPSESLAKLLKVASKVPAVLPILAADAGVSVENQTVELIAREDQLVQSDFARVMSRMDFAKVISQMDFGKASRISDLLLAEISTGYPESRTYLAEFSGYAESDTTETTVRIAAQAPGVRTTARAH